MSEPVVATAETPHPRRWYTTNLVGVPAAVLAGTTFNAHPHPLTIPGTHATHAGLFTLLARSPDIETCREVFAHYMRLVFGLTPPPGERQRDPGTRPDDRPDRPSAEQRRWRTSYLKLLQGWGLDSNSAAGAVFKGWVESRFGLVPGFHKAPLTTFPSPAWIGYLEEKAGSRYHNNSIWQQLDLLFEFCQWMLRRWPALLPGDAPDHVTLWRGSTRVEEQVIAGSLRERRCVVRLNNLVSFSLSRDDAGCFGDWILEARVPRAKLVYVPGLVRGQVLQGEGKVLALGGDYDVEARHGP
jgi:NAD+--dinitrogen-reductase ADP-D-ribosyltransferase